MSEQYRVMVIDGDEASRERIQEALAGEYEVVLEDNAETALEHLDIFEPDIFLIEVDLPGMGGLDLCKILKQNVEFVKAPVIFMAEGLDREAIMECYKSGGCFFIPKPLKEDLLLRNLKMQLAEKGKLREKTLTIEEVREVQSNPEILGMQETQAEASQEQALQYEKEDEAEAEALREQEEADKRAEEEEKEGQEQKRKKAEEARKREEAEDREKELAEARIREAKAKKQEEERKAREEEEKRAAEEKAEAEQKAREEEEKRAEEERQAREEQAKREEEERQAREKAEAEKAEKEKELEKQKAEEAEKSEPEEVKSDEPSAGDLSKPEAEALAEPETADEDEAEEEEVDDSESLCEPASKKERSYASQGESNTSGCGVKTILFLIVLLAFGVFAYIYAGYHPRPGQIDSDDIAPLTFERVKNLLEAEGFSPKERPDSYDDQKSLYGKSIGANGGEIEVIITSPNQGEQIARLTMTLRGPVAEAESLKAEGSSQFIKMILEMFPHSMTVMQQVKAWLDAAEPQNDMATPALLSMPHFIRPQWNFRATIYFYNPESSIASKLLMFEIWQ
ncbi:MAG: PleD family two-component system response regulator [Candidatus Sumerlaeia bacterium]